MSNEDVEVPAMEIHDLTVSYQKKPVLYGIDMAVPSGSMVGVVGPNGAGKSTLIKSVMGLIQFSDGWVKVFGEDLKKNIISGASIEQLVLTWSDDLDRFENTSKNYRIYR